MDTKKSLYYEKVNQNDDSNDTNNNLKFKTKSLNEIVEEDAIPELGQMSILASSKYSIRRHTAILDVKTSTYIASLADDIKKIDIKVVQVNEKIVEKLKRFEKYRHLYGYFFIAIYGLLFSLSTILIKRAFLLAGSDNSVIRYILLIFFMLPIIYHKRLNCMGKKSLIKLLSVRGLISSLGIVCFNFSVTLIAPSDSVAIANSSIIITAILAKIFLKEKFTFVHFLTLLMTIGGIILISQPSFIFKKSEPLAVKNKVNISTILNQGNLCIDEILKIKNLTKDIILHEFKSRNLELIDDQKDCIVTLYNEYKSLLNDTSDDDYCIEEEVPEIEKFSIKFYLGIIFALLYAVTNGTVQVILKKLSMEKVHFSITTIYASYFGLPISIAVSTILFLTGISHKHFKHEIHFHLLPIQIMFSMASAICGIGAQICLTLALNYEESSKISIIRTVDLLFAFLLQFIFLGIRPDYLNVIGAVLILSGSFFIIGFKIVERKRLEMRNAKLMLTVEEQPKV